MHHRCRNIDLTEVGQGIPLLKQARCYLGYDRRIADDAAMVEGGRHDAPMPAPGFSLTGQETAAEIRVQGAGDLVQTWCNSRHCPGARVEWRSAD